MAPYGAVKVFSLSYFRHAKSNYEIPACGVNQGVYFSNYLHAVVHAFWATFGNEYWLTIHHDDRVKEANEFRFLQELERRSLLRLVDCGKAETLCGAMLWRLEPLFDEDVELVISRDIDSLPMPRDRKMVEAFYKTSGYIHGINDSESHSIALMGGMIAVKGDAFRRHFTKSQWEFLKSTYDLSNHGSDQQFLNNVLYPAMASKLVVHTRRQTVSYPCLRSYPALPQEDPLDYVVKHIGAGFDTAKCMDVLKPRIYPHKEVIEECWNATV